MFVQIIREDDCPPMSDKERAVAILPTDEESVTSCVLPSGPLPGRMNCIENGWASGKGLPSSEKSFNL